MDRADDRGALAWLKRQPADVRAAIDTLAYAKGREVWGLDGFPEALYQAVLPEAMREYRAARQ